MFAKQWQRVKTEVEELYRRLAAMGDTEAALAALSQLDLEQVLLDDLGFSATLKKMAVAHLQVLSSAEAVAPVPEVYLQALTRMSNEIYIAKTGAGLRDMMSLITRAVIDKRPESEVIEELAKTGLTQAQAEALANDTLRKYSRTVSAVQAEEVPDQLWIYEGPVDSRTSDICLEILAAGPMTKAEIDSRFPGAFTAGGHYNCRHEFHPYTEREQYEKRAIDQQIEGRDL